MESTLTKALEKAAQTEYGVRFFARNGEVETFAYARLYADAARAAAHLRAAGVQAGDSVALILSTSYELVASIFGVLLARAVPTCLATPRLGRMNDYAEATTSMLNAARAKLVLSDASALKSVAPVAAAAELQPPVLTPDALMQDGPQLVEDVAPEDLALIQFSSGTTVEPKPVALSHGNITANARSILGTFPGDINDHSGCSWLPLHHDMGLIGGLFTAVLAPGDMTLLRPEDFIARPATWLRALSESKATICPAPNFALQICTDRVKDEEIAELDLSHWEIALIGAETVREHTLRRFAERFAPAGFRYESFTPVYGLAEATLAVTFSNPKLAPKSLRVRRPSLGEGRVDALNGSVQEEDTPDAISVMSVGRPLDGVELEIRDARGSVLAEDRVGRIFVRGASVMQGYFGRAEATAKAIAGDGFLDTGDLGFLHAGELYIYGREKDIIILNGRNHDPQTIEFALDRVAGLQHERAAAVPIDDDGRGTEGFAIIVEKEKGKGVDPEELAVQAREAVIGATGLIPEQVVVLEIGRLPRTTSGKIKRGTARQLLLSNDLEILAISKR